MTFHWVSSYQNDLIVDYFAQLLQPFSEDQALDIYSLAGQKFDSLQYLILQQYPGSIFRSDLGLILVNAEYMNQTYQVTIHLNSSEVITDCDVLRERFENMIKNYKEVFNINDNISVLTN